MNLLMDQDMNVKVFLNQASSLAFNESSVAVGGETVVDGGGGMEGGEMGDPGLLEGTAKEPLLSSVPVVIGISAAAIILGLVIGVILAKKKIKKGIELYED